MVFFSYWKVSLFHLKDTFNEEWAISKQISTQCPDTYSFLFSLSYALLAIQQWRHVNCSILKTYIAENSTHGNKSIFLAKTTTIETHVKLILLPVSDYIPSKTHLLTNHHGWQKESYKGLNYFRNQYLHDIFLWTQNSNVWIDCDHSDF